MKMHPEIYLESTCFYCLTYFFFLFISVKLFQVAQKGKKKQKIYFA